MDKKSKEALLRRYKKARRRSESSTDSSSDSDSGSSSSYSSDSDRKPSDRHRKRARRSSSSTERRKREKRERCQKKLEAKRMHLKRKLKEAKLKKRAAVAAAVLSGHTSHRALSPSTQAKLKKLAERKQLRALSKESRGRDREKHRAAARDREREHHRTSRSPTKLVKMRMHPDAKRQKSPTQVHHPLMPREKLIIQTRTRNRTPSAERLRQEEIMRERERRERERERNEREAARDKERAEALARCQERQRERERIAREKLRREEEEKRYGSGERVERLLPRPSEREIGGRAYSSRERSLDAVELSRHMSKREIDVFEREREYLEAERRGLLADREKYRREREYLPPRRRNLSPVEEHYPARMREHIDVYPPEERERPSFRAFLGEPRHLREREPWVDPIELRERELLDVREPHELRGIDHNMIVYPEERERFARQREGSHGPISEWKSDWTPHRERDWEEIVPPVRSGFVGGPKRPVAPPNTTVTPKAPIREHCSNSEPDWDADENEGGGGLEKKSDDGWADRNTRNLPMPRDKPSPGGRMEVERRWQTDWHEGEAMSPRSTGPVPHHHRSERGGRGGFRRGGPSGGFEHGDRFRANAPILTLPPIQPPGANHIGSPRFPSKRSMTYTNPNLIKKQQAALAAAVAAASTAVAATKAAAQSAANSVTNPGILGQVSGKYAQLSNEEKPEAGEIVADNDSNGKPDTPKKAECNPEKPSGELSEISDSDDEILDKSEKKLKVDLPESVLLGNAKSGVTTVEKLPTKDEQVEPETDEKLVKEKLLDFEEISDDELEEEARNKGTGVGDALGVDWASLIAESNRQPDNVGPQMPERCTTAKQNWQPQRVILNIGISTQMAGEEYAKKLLNEARNELAAESSEKDYKVNVAEVSMNGVESGEVNSEQADCKPLQPPNALNVELNLNMERLKLIANACGPNSRALSARMDLRLRRRLCGLPVDCDTAQLHTTSEKIKNLALAAFQRALAV